MRRMDLPGDAAGAELVMHSSAIKPAAVDDLVEHTGIAIRKRSATDRASFSNS